MTSLQKTILEWLLEGGLISGSQKYGYRLKDSTGNPLVKFNHRTFHSLKDLLRFDHGSFRLDKKYVRSLSKRYWIKKMYVEYLKKQKLSQPKKRP